MNAIEEKATPAFVNISLESGGDHRFDLRHLWREGGGRLVQFLLQTAGFGTQAQWRVRVEKKLACGAETKAMTVVGSKPWCCYLKIKPGDNNTAHFCSLLMPDGYKGEVVYEALKSTEEQVNLAWRQGAVHEREPMPDNLTSDGVNGTSRATAALEAAHRLFDGPPPPETTAPPLPAPAAKLGQPAEAGPAAATEDQTGGTELRGWSLDPDKLRLTLLAIHEVGQEGKAGDVDEFAAILAGKLGWQGLRRKQIGGVFTSMVRKGQILRVRQGSRALGYALTAEGQRLVSDLMPPGTAVTLQPSDGPLSAPTVRTAPTDPASLAAALANAAQSYVADYQSLQANRERRAQLVAEIERLDAEADALNRVVSNAEVQALLAKLLQVTVAASTHRGNAAMALVSTV